MLCGNNIMVYWLAHSIFSCVQIWYQKPRLGWKAVNYQPSCPMIALRGQPAGYCAPMVFRLQNLRSISFRTSLSWMISAISTSTCCHGTGDWHSFLVRSPSWHSCVSSVTNKQKSNTVIWDRDFACQLGSNSDDMIDWSWIYYLHIIQL